VDTAFDMTCGPWSAWVPSDATSGSDCDTRIGATIPRAGSAAARSSAPSASLGTITSLLRSRTRRAPSRSASRIPRLQPAEKPSFVSATMRRTFGSSVARSSAEPSREALSTTIVAAVAELEASSERTAAMVSPGVR
jgi:hypothetical protein